MLSVSNKIFSFSQSKAESCNFILSSGNHFFWGAKEGAEFISFAVTFAW